MFVGRLSVGWGAIDSGFNGERSDPVTQNSKDFALARRDMCLC